MACAVSLTPMGSPSDSLIWKSLYQVDRLVWSMPLVLAFLSLKEGKNQKNETSTSQNWVGANEVFWMPGLKL